MNSKYSTKIDLISNVMAPRQVHRSCNKILNLASRTQDGMGQNDTFLQSAGVRLKDQNITHYNNIFAQQDRHFSPRDGIGFFGHLGLVSWKSMRVSLFEYHLF